MFPFFNRLSLAIASLFAITIAAAAPVSAQIEQPKRGASAYVTNLDPGGFLNIRSEPSPVSETVAKLNDGDTVTMTGNRQKYDTKWWLEIRSSAGAGWVNGQYLSPSSTGTATAGPSPFRRHANTEIERDAFREFTANSINQCEAACLNEQKCVAVEFYKDRQQCGLHSNSAPTAKKATVDVSIRQAAPTTAAVARTPTQTQAAAVEDNLAEQGTHWELAGSKLVLTVDGDQWAFRYLEPRPGMMAEGVRRGTVLFKGREQGASLNGTAYRFSKRCGPLPYEVSGQFEPEGGILTMQGVGPRGMSKDCKSVTHTESYTITMSPLATEAKKLEVVRGDSDRYVRSVVQDVCEGHIPQTVRTSLGYAPPLLIDKLVSTCRQCLQDSLKTEFMDAELARLDGLGSSQASALDERYESGVMSKHRAAVSKCSDKVLLSLDDN